MPLFFPSFALKLPTELTCYFCKTQCCRLLLMFCVHIFHCLAQIAHCLNSFSNLIALISLISSNFILKLYIVIRRNILLIEHITAELIITKIHIYPTRRPVFPAHETIVWRGRQDIWLQYQEFIQRGRVSDRRSAAAYVLISGDRA